MRSDRLTTEQFIEKAKAIHGEKYDYSQSIYITKRLPVSILCPAHGIFEQTAGNHTAGKSGCPKCAQKPHYSTAEFINLAGAVHGLGRYDYSQTVYASSQAKVKIGCPTHGIFEQRPDGHLQGKGCHKCATTKSLKSSTIMLTDLSVTDKQSIISRYKLGEGSSAIGKDFGISWVTVLRVLKSCNITIRQGSYAHRTKMLREDAFAEITPESAYWIGFLMADGHVKYRSATTAVVGLVLQEKDKGHIEKYRDFLCSSHKIHMDNPKHKISANAQKQFGLFVSSFKMVKHLEVYGLGINKTFTAKVTHDELAVNPNFWRGVIDGDGSIGIGKKGQAVLHLIGTNALLTQFQSFIKLHYPASAANPRKAGKVAQLAIEHRAAEAIVCVLYRDALISLERKQEIAQRILAKADELNARKCAHCSKPVPLSMNRRTKYCSAICRVKNAQAKYHRRRPAQFLL